jgi:hypothetical protein
VRGELLGCHHQVGGGVGHHVQEHRRAAGSHGLGVEVDAREVLAGEHRRVDQRLDADGLEVDLRAGCCLGVPGGGGGCGGGCRGPQRGAEFPAVGQAQAGRYGDVAVRIPGRVEQHRVPLKVQHVGRHHHASAVTRQR